MYFDDAARTSITYDQDLAAKASNGDYLKLSDHTLYRGWSTVTVEP
jgi:hypothetical protein